MSRFILVLPHQAGEQNYGGLEPGVGKFRQRKHEFRGKEFQSIRRRGFHFISERLGRLDEGEWSTTGRPWVMLCTGSPMAFARVQTKFAADPLRSIQRLGVLWNNAARKATLRRLAGGVNPTWPLFGGQAQPRYAEL